MKVFLHATYSCNANCVHCAVPRRPENISFPTFQTLVDTVDMEFLVIGGGEPLLHPRINDMVDYAHRKTKVKIETNGRLLTRETLDELSPKLFQLNVSLDGSEETHNSIRGIPTYQHTTSMIAYARSLGLDVAVWSVVMKPNFQEAEGLIEIVKSTGADKLSFLYATPVRKCSKDFLVEPSEYVEFVRRVQEQASDEFQIRVAPYILPFDSNPAGLDCLINNGDILHVDPKGDVYPCVLLLDNPKFRMGKVGEELQTVRVDNPKQCIGLQEALGADYRTEHGVPVCPCKTVTKEWTF